jgi:FkbM family methyltransferase
MVKFLNALFKIYVIITNVKNWYMLLLDKLSLCKNIIYKFRNGLLVYCRPKSSDINEAVVVISGLEYPKKYLYLKNAEDLKIIFDIGGNIGAFSLLFHSLNKNINYIGYIFEPHLTNFEILKKNLKINRIKKFIPIQKAILSSCGRVKLDVSGSFDSFSINSNSRNYIYVQSVSLPRFCNSMRIKFIDILKMDIEGAEYEIFEKTSFFLKST